MINFEFSAKSILQQMGLGPSKDEIQNDQPQQSLHNVANHQTETRCDFLSSADAECSNESPKKPPPSENEPTKSAAKPSRRSIRLIDPPHRVLRSHKRVLRSHSREIQRGRTSSRGSRPKKRKFPPPSTSLISTETLPTKPSAIMNQSSENAVDTSNGTDNTSIIVAPPAEHNTSKKRNKYTVQDAVDLVVNKGLSAPESLRVTYNVCTRQNLYQLVKKRKEQNKNGVHAGKVVGASDTNISSVSSSVSPRQQRKTIIQTNQDRIEAKQKKIDFDIRYNNAIKEATDLWNSTKETREKKMHNPNYVGYESSINKILVSVNKKYLMNENKQLKKGTFFRYYSKNIKERLAHGPNKKLPNELINIIRLHIKMQQLSKKSQVSGRDVQNMIGLAVKGTEFENCCTKAAWLRVRKEYPEEVIPCTVSTVDSLRLEWTTYSKINDWFTANKKTLLESGLAIDKEEVQLDGSLAKITIGKIEADRIINFDETDHPLSTQYDKGGNRSLRWSDPSLPKGSQKSTRSNSHTTGIYGTTANGSVMPPVYIFDTHAKDEKNFQVKPSWCQNLPSVIGSYGGNNMIESDSYVTVRKSGCSDEKVVQDLIEKVYLPLFPNVSKTTTRDENGVFLSGPVVFKTDSGQGRLSATWDSLEFRERMSELGVLLVLGLPNSTSCTQEQDQLYQEFKGKTQQKTNEIYQDKLSRRSGLISKYNIELEATSLDDLETRMVIIKNLAEARKMPKLTNEDLGFIVNGYPEDNISKKPFQSTFTKEKIRECFRRVGYVPFTRRCLQNKNIRHELQDGDEEKSKQIAEIVEEYEDVKNKLRSLGFKVDGIFDAEIEVAPVIRREEEEEKQV